MEQWGRYDLWVGPRHSMDSELWPCSSSSPRTRMRFCPYQFLLSCPAGRWGLIRSFVLSGFLITALLLKEQARFGSIRRWAFYKRRIVRLLPPLFFLLVANVILAVVTNSWVPPELGLASLGCLLLLELLPSPFTKCLLRQLVTRVRAPVVVIF